MKAARKGQLLFWVLEMLGAIIGDIKGTAMAVAGGQPKESPSVFTDDTVLTVACAETLVDAVDKRYVAQASDFERHYRKWADLYPNHGYGKRFTEWLKNPTKAARDSWGNGAPMRVSPCGWASPTLKGAMYNATNSAWPSHQHPWAIAGAQAIAGSVFIAANKGTKDRIRHFLKNSIANGISIDLEISFANKDVVSSKAEITVPLALNAFFESTDFETALELAIQNSQDKDTVADMACAVAEAYYGIPLGVAERVLNLLPHDMLEVVRKFYHLFVPYGTLSKSGLLDTIT
ncbi:MAG: ADP-ribosylglycohydrolase family protein [Burkholderiales bacterium]|nr:ADP-ribosylglycohydrolase family protein [Burkholderiales bacterium]